MTDKKLENLRKEELISYCKSLQDELRICTQQLNEERFDFEKASADQGIQRTQLNQVIVSSKEKQEELEHALGTMRSVIRASLVVMHPVKPSQKLSDAHQPHAPKDTRHFRLLNYLLTIPESCEASRKNSPYMSH